MVSIEFEAFYYSIENNSMVKSKDVIILEDLALIILFKPLAHVLNSINITKHVTYFHNKGGRKRETFCCL